jgi:hypothetical protein
MECQVEKNEHFQHILFYEFNRGSKAAESAETFVLSPEKTILLKEQPNCRSRASSMAILT